MHERALSQYGGGFPPHSNEFNNGIGPSLSNGELSATYHQYTTGMVKLLVTSFEALVETVKSTGLQISFEELDIYHTGGEEEKVSK